jgi:glycosyltransferase involved in cell wall biosynthesis
MVAEIPAIPRIALLADYLEERWPSMDLAAEMLAHHLPKAVSSGEMKFECLRPPFKARLGRLGFLNRRSMHNTDRLLNRFFDYPRFLRKAAGAFDLFHLVDHSYSQLVHELPANRTIVTCHDLDTFRCLWAADHDGRGLAFVSMTRRILRGLQKAAHVCCDSAATRDDLMERSLLPPEKVSVIPLGVHPAFLALPDSKAEAKIDELLGRSGERDRSIYLLHVGSTIPRKRIDLLIEIFARLSENEPRLRLLRVGGDLTATQQAQIVQSKVNDKINILPFLTPEELAAVYRRAALVLLPSDAEGFGFPVIEAMASGTAILASDLPVLREVGGDIASYAPPGDADAWVEKATEVLTSEQNRPPGGQERRELRRRWAEKFTWDRTALAVAAIYRKVLQQ